MDSLEDLVAAVKFGDLQRVRFILDLDGPLVHRRDATGATALHYAALQGHRQIAELLIERGADVNCADDLSNATPAGWAIEYLREKGGHLAIELDDLAYAIREGDVRWVDRWLTRFPGLRHANHLNGVPFRQLAVEAGHAEVISFFE